MAEKQNPKHEPKPGTVGHRRPEEASPLDGILEDPKPTDHGVASLDKALWDPSRDRSEVERNSEKRDKT